MIMVCVWCFVWLFLFGLLMMNGYRCGSGLSVRLG